MKNILYASLMLFLCSTADGICTLCPKGETPPNTNPLVDLSDRFPNISTCQALNELADFQALDGIDCSFEQTYSGINHCGCEPPQCDLCPKGDIPFAGNSTCEETQLRIYFSILGGESGAFGTPIPLDDDVCDGFRIEEPALCGCSQLDLPCTYCSDGSVSPGSSTENHRSCTGTLQTMPFVPSTSALCTYLQEFNHRNCGCAAGPAKPASACQVTCPEGMEINRTECKLADLEGATIIPADSNLCTQFVATLPGCCSLTSDSTNMTTVPPDGDSSAYTPSYPMLLLAFIGVWSLALV